ncbi:C6 finger domain protein [Cordyceps fumosorosea ARSEF 2679]|uniref:C6 finger domain protein n=1 Tax=Cordyceps fumosorosea (strain ARSEF 2679) TaxID=1081104 RepID=A0A167VX97_CORFA|nr:C6 finger domain protein [Cordyceps fumosorosea ARSEF 2679]OAA63079.1 C6 finger domain protein [Cordyceps fumosorosea ARSEF 2679]
MPHHSLAATAAAVDSRTAPSVPAASSSSSVAQASSADAAAAAAAAANKTRRSHRKSRNGCTECKRRHIRCDEHRPLCSNCVSADRTCVFPRGSAAVPAASTPNGGGVSNISAATSNGSHRHHSVAAPTPPSSHHLPSPRAGNATANTPSPRRDFSFDEVCGPLPHPSTTPGDFRRSNYTYYPNTAGSSALNGNTAPLSPAPGLDPDPSASASLFTPFHLQLMHHIQTVMLPDPTINTNNHFQQFIDIAMRHAVDAPYLINELLALAAVHMATQKENQLLQQQQQQQNQHQTQAQDGNGSSSSAANTPGSSSLHAPTVLPPLLPPHGSPSSTSSPASSSSAPLPSLLTTTAAAIAATNPAVANLRHQATELQTRAVANFTRLTAHLPPDDTASCIPRFLFSSTLSMHALADSLAELRAANADFHGFIDRFVDCFNLYRGIRAVIYPTWRFLSDSELRPLLQVTHEANLGIVARGRECAPLSDLLARSDLAPASLDACRTAVEKLQWAFDLCNNLPPDSGQHAVSAFSVIVGAEFVDVLRKHRPEALIILSYFAVLLHRCRHFWIFQNSGACMIKAIANHIGSFWRDAMAWPLQVVDTEDC